MTIAKSDWTNFIFIKFGLGLTLALFLSNVLLAQQITLETALDSAIQNNLTVRNSELIETYKEKLTSSYATLPKTAIFSNLGQLNSFYADYQFGIEQSLEFPKVYSNQRKVLNEEWKSAELNSQLTKAEIKKEVANVFYAIVILRQKEKLLLKSDSLFLAFFKEETDKMHQGIEDLYEKTSTEIQHGKIQLQLKAVRSEIEIAKLKLQILLNTKESYEPISKELKIPEPLNVEKNALSSHPMLKLYEQQKSISEANYKLEKSKLMPEIQFGYYNITMKGSGSDDRVYDYSTRFHSANIGLGVPIFYKAQKAVIAAEKFNIGISENEYNLKNQEMNLEVKQNLIRYRTALENVKFFEDVELPQSKIIFQSAKEKHLKEEIGYFEWVMISNDVIEIQNNYYDAIAGLNEIIIELRYLNEK